ncbi:hypothetical protein Aperf_G00000027719 [Anoplocephala perfoliata]
MIQALNSYVIFLLLIYQAQVIWGDECCKCPDSAAKSGGAGSNTGSLSEEKQELLKLQNEFRRQVAQGKVPRQPASSKIKDLKWNTELEASAQRLANTCVFGHDRGDQRKTAKWWWVGQNIAYSSSIAQNVQMWFDEHKDYHYDSNYCTGVCGHYTQLVWANTTDVGCGVKNCRFSGFDAIYAVCNYGPG